MKKLIIISFILFSNVTLAERKRLVELSWEAITGAVSYEVEVSRSIKSGNKKVISTDTVYSFSWSKKLASGEYLYRLRSLDFRKVPGPWSSYIPFFVNLASVNLIRPYDSEVIEGINRKNLSMLFAWSEVVGARYYLLEIFNSKGRSIYKRIHTKTKVYVSLKTSKTYTWRVEALRTKKDPIPPPVNTRLIDIKGPPLKAVTISLKKGKNALLFKWNKSPNAKNYAYHLYKMKSGNWIKISSKEKNTKRRWVLKTNKLKSATYKFIVDANAPGRSSSKRSAFEFNWTGRIVEDEVKMLEEPLTISAANEAIRLVRSPFESYVLFSTPTGSYNGYEDSTLSDVNHKLTAQRFALGFNYTTPNSNNIWSIALEMDNFVNSRDAWQMFIADLKYDWYWGDKFRLNFGFGLFYKGTPLITVLQDGTSTNGVISTAGVSNTIKLRYNFVSAWFFEYELQTRAHLYGTSLPEGELKTSFENNMLLKVIYRYGDLIDFSLGYESGNVDLSYSGSRTENDNKVNVSISGLNAGVTIPF